MTNDQAARDLLTRLDLRAEDLLELEGITESSDATAFLSGSLVERMGNATSDLDVFVVGAAEPRGEHIHHIGEAVLSVHMYKKRRVDFEYWSDDAVACVANKLDELSTANGGRSNVLLERRFAREEVVLVHRVRTGLPLLNEKRFEALRNRFDYNRLSSYLARVKLEEIDDALEDVQGLMNDGEIDVGLLRVHELLNAVCSAYGHHLGSTSFHGKWRTRVLESYRGKAHADEVLDRFLELQFPDARRLRTDLNAFMDYARRCIQFCHTVTDWIIG